MADTITLSAGTADGAVVATDDAGAAGHVQIVKLAVSADGSATAIGADNTNGLDVDVTRVSGNVTVVQATATNLKVDASSVAVPVTDNGATLSIDDGGGAITVDGTVGISGTVTVDSELTTADLDTGAGTDTRAVVGLVGSASGGGQLIPGSSADGLLVNLGANNDVTVTGTVTANAGTNLNTSALALESGGNLAAAATSLALLDDAVFTDDAAYTPGASKRAGGHGPGRRDNA